MKAKLMNGTYYLINGGLSEDVIVNLAEHPDWTDKGAISEAIDTERSAYKNTYKDGVIIETIRLHDNGDCFRYTVGSGTYYEPLPSNMQYRYAMLSRLQMDCEYFLGNGDGYEGHLWAGSVEEQIKEMRKRWNEFAEDEKPEWLTMEQIDDYEQKMFNHPHRQAKVKREVDEDVWL